MPRYYTWEAALPDSKVAHAVTVLEVDDGPIEQLLHPDGPTATHTGDRSSETFCNIKVGQGVYPASVRRTLIRSQARLYTKAELANHVRCKNCLRSLSARIRGRSDSYWIWPGHALEEWIEWPEERPLYPEEPVIVNTPAPAPWPTYYRYQVVLPTNSNTAAETITVGGVQYVAILENYWSWLPQGTVIVGTPTGNWHYQWNEAAYGRDYHGLMTRPLLEPDPEHERQDEVARGRAAEQREWMTQVRHIHDTERGRTFAIRDVHAMELARDVMGEEAIRQLAAEGFVDIPSGIQESRGYRLRPWRRIGHLLKDAEGRWTELPKSLCIHPDETYPPGDELVTLWLELTFNETNLLFRANQHDNWADPQGDFRIEEDATPYPTVLARHVLGLPMTTPRIERPENVTL